MTRFFALACSLVLGLWSAAVWAQEARGVVYDFNATWCGPCQQMKPVVEKLAREGLPVKAVDVDQYKSFADQFKVSSIPAFVLVVDGKEVDRHVGAMSEMDLRKMVAKIPTSRPVSNVNPASPPANNSSGMPVELGQPGAFRNSAPDNLQREETRVADNDPKRGLLDRLPFGRREEKPEAPEVVRGNDNSVGAGLHGLAMAEAANPQPTSDPMRASVRIRVVTNGQVAMGSGTIIHSREGISRILTCAHVFEKATGDSRIEVDIFENGKAKPLLGTLLKRDLKADLGMISVNSAQLLPMAAMGGADALPKVQDAVSAIGCDGGKDPTRENLKVTDIDKYEEPHNLLCTGLPVQGRSGGGLFDEKGRVIGVCSGADQQDRRGFYSGLLAIHAFLRDCGMEDLYQPRNLSPAAPPMNIAAAPVREFPAGVPAKIETAPVHTQSAAPMDLEAGDAEVVVIVRSKTQPNAPNRVIIIHEASSKFMSYLSDELPPGESSSVFDTRHASTSANAPGVARELNTQAAAPFPPTPALDKSRVVPTTLTQPEAPQKYVRGTVVR